MIFATNNRNKIAEIQRQLGEGYTFQSLQDIGCTEEIPETTGTIEGNAQQKARYVAEHYGVDCFSEDTGLIVDVLGGRPGVDTAHYAGPERDAEANNQKLLAELGDTPNRSARFKTVICFIRNGEEHLFEGISEGMIAWNITSDEGWGYDPVFIPVEGGGKSYAELGDAKQAYSHRGRAVAKLVSFLRGGA